MPRPCTYTLGRAGCAVSAPSAVSAASSNLAGPPRPAWSHDDPPSGVVVARARADRLVVDGWLFERSSSDDPLLDVAMELEKIALNDEYFVEKKLYPNIDFYSGITLKAMGFPTTMFTVLFALARTVGWVAQWNEMVEDPSQRIGRPRQLYIGSPKRDYIDIAKR